MTEVTPERIKEFLGELEKRKIQYVVIAGVGLDGKRGHLTRKHQDLDVLCLKNDLPKVEQAVKTLGYSGKRYNDLYKLQRDDGSKVDLGLVTIEDSDAVTYGRIAVTRFPKELFTKPQIGRIGGIKFNIAPNELLKTWGLHSQKELDSEYARSLPVDENLVKKIKRVLRKDM